MENMIIGNLDNEEELKKVTAYYDDRIAIIDSLDSATITYSRIRMDAFLATMCLSGKGCISVDNRQYEISKGKLLIGHPNVIIERIMVSTDFKCCGFVFSSEYMEQLALLDLQCWDAKFFVEQHPVLSLNEEEALLFRQYYQLLHSKLLGKQGEHYKEVVDSLLQAFLYEFHDSIKRFYAAEPLSYSSAENLFRNFMQLLTSSHPKERTVNAYAARLCVSPKYLSAVCKEVSGHTASELINKYVLKDIKYQLSCTRKSIKEIVNELDFPNISFFGKYVKRYTGVSPRRYREQASLGAEA